MCPGANKRQKDWDCETGLGKLGTGKLDWETVKLGKLGTVKLGL